jgi:hypothetical protein
MATQTGPITLGETFAKRPFLPAQLNPYLIFNRGSISASPLSGICQQAKILTRHRTLAG